jgi:hypothetical protein
MWLNKGSSPASIKSMMCVYCGCVGLVKVCGEKK